MNPALGRSDLLTSRGARRVGAAHTAPRESHLFVLTPELTGGHLLSILSGGVVFEVLKVDRDVALALTGQSSIADVDRSALYQALSPVAHSYPGTKALRSSSQR